MEIPTVKVSMFFYNQLKISSYNILLSYHLSLWIIQKVMHNNNKNTMEGSRGSSSENMVGWRADQYRGVLKLRHPMQNGVIEDWDAMLDVSYLRA